MFVLAHAPHTNVGLKGAVRCALVVAFLCGLAPSVTRARASDGPVTTRIDPCVPIDRAQFQRLLAIEFGMESASLDAEGDGSAAVVTLTCVEGAVQLRLDDPVTRKSMTRIVDVARVEPQSRSRLMALTVAEFVVASWLELRLSEKPKIEPVGPPPPPAAERNAAAVVERHAPAVVAPARDATTQLSAAFEVMSFFSEFELIPAGALRVLQKLAPAFAIDAALQFGVGSVSGALGDSREQVSLQLTTLSLLASALYFARAGEFELMAGAGARLGFISLEGSRARDPNFDAERDYVPWAGPVALLGVNYRATRELRIGLRLEAGFLRHIRATVGRNDGVVAELRSGWSGLSLGVGWSL